MTFPFPAPYIRTVSSDYIFTRRQSTQIPQGDLEAYRKSMASVSASFCGNKDKTGTWWD